MQDAGGVSAEKHRLRAELAAARRARSSIDIDAARAAVCSVVVAASAGWTCVAAYEPLRTEPGSTALLAALAARGVRVLVPVTQPDRDLDWVEWGTAVSSGRDAATLGLDAVRAASAVLVPALAVAADGTRLGRGGGSYDRALPRCAPGTPRVALLFAGELVDALPAGPWDQPVTDVVQPSGWTTLG